MQGERRYMPISEIEIRAEDGGEPIIEGYPIVYETPAALWGFREIIHKGAATEVIKEADELVLWNHNSSQPMARRSNGTLVVTEDDHGVRIRADVSKTVWGRNGYEAIHNGLIDKMSFAFDVEPEGVRWTYDVVDGVRIETRHIDRFSELLDYSPVSYPAYKDTEVQARSKELAMRFRPDPGAPEDDQAAAAARDLLRVKVGLTEIMGGIR
ncbi:MAG: HK97 family phage prohead protease [Spirochaetota bacterium]